MKTIFAKEEREEIKQDKYNQAVLAEDIAVQKGIASIFDHIQRLRVDSGKDPLPLNDRFNHDAGKAMGESWKFNTPIPDADMFDLSNVVVSPKDEPFASRKIFNVNREFHAGSREVGYDILKEEGTAVITACGVATNADNYADISINRSLQQAVRVSAKIKLTRDDALAFDMRNRRGYTAIVSPLQRKYEVARKNIMRAAERIIWRGSDDGNQEPNLQSVFDNVLTSDATTNANFNLLGRVEDTATTGTGNARTWSTKTAQNIVSDIVTGVQWTNRDGVYNPNALVINPNGYARLFGSQTADTSIIRLAAWIREFFQAYTPDPLFVNSTVMNSANTPYTTDAFMILDNDKSNFELAILEDVTLLPPDTRDGNIEQIVTMAIGGVLAYHPRGMYIGRGI